MTHTANDFPPPPAVATVVHSCPCAECCALRGEAFRRSDLSLSLRQRGIPLANHTDPRPVRQFGDE